MSKQKSILPAHLHKQQVITEDSNGNVILTTLTGETNINRFKLTARDYEHRVFNRNEKFNRVTQLIQHMRTNVGDNVGEWSTVKGRPATYRAHQNIYHCGPDMIVSGGLDVVYRTVAALTDKLPNNPRGTSLPRGCKQLRTKRKYAEYVLQAMFDAGLIDTNMYHVKRRALSLL